MIKKNKDISVVIGSYNRKQYLKLTIESVRKELDKSKINYEIIVVDGGSDDGTLKWLINQKDIISIIQHNRGKWKGKDIKRRSWGYFMNLGFKSAQGNYVCMLSDDCLVVPGAIINGYNHFEEQLRLGRNVGAIAFYWRGWPGDSKYLIGLTFGNKIFVNHGLYLKDALEDVGYIDETTYSFYHADGDLCLKMWDKGYECIDSPESFIEHFSHANDQIRVSNLEKQLNDLENLKKKWEHVFNIKQDGSLVKEHIDKYNTAEKFRTLNYIVKSTLKKIYLKIRQNMKRIIKLFLSRQ